MKFHFESGFCNQNIGVFDPCNRCYQKICNLAKLSLIGKVTKKVVTNGYRLQNGRQKAG